MVTLIDGPPRRIILLIAAIFASSTLFAKTVYVHDVIYVPLRGGASDEHEIINKGIPSGTALELLSIDEANHYTQVRLKDGTVGWVKSQFLSTEPISRDKVKQLEGVNEKIKSDRAELLAALDESVAAMARLDAEKNSLQRELEELREEVATLKTLSADVIEIHEENRTIKGRSELLADELDTLTVQNLELQDTRNQRWFLIGAGTLLLGLFPGYILARSIYRRNSQWA